MSSRRKWSYNDAYEKRNVACSSCGQLVIQEKGTLYDMVRFSLGSGENNRSVEATIVHTCDIEARFHYQESLEAAAREAVSALLELDLDLDQIGQTGRAEKPLSKKELIDMGSEVKDKLHKARALVYEMSMTVRCPRCDASVGDRCENLRDRKKDVLSYTKKPHAERVPEDAIKHMEEDDVEYNVIRDHSVSQKRLDDEWNYFHKFNREEHDIKQKSALIHRASAIRQQLEELLAEGKGDEQPSS